MLKNKLSKFLLIALMFNLSMPTTIFAQENSSDPEEIELALPLLENHC